MPNTFQPYSDPSNLEAIRAMSWEIIHTVEPEEDISAKKLVDRLVKGCEEGKLPVVDDGAENAGGFGGIDLITLVVVPLIVAALGELCKQLITWGINDLKEWVKKSRENKKQLTEMVDVVVEQKYEEVIGKVKSKKTRGKEKIIKQTTKVSIKKMLDVES